MMQTRDWVSGALGAALFVLGLLPFLNHFGKGPSWGGFSLPLSVMGWIAAIFGLYLIYNSFVEITNSNVVGWVSFFVAAVITLFGVLHVLGSIGKLSGFLAVQWIPDIMFNVFFMALGIFLMIATFAMEL